MQGPQQTLTRVANKRWLFFFVRSCCVFGGCLGDWLFSDMRFGCWSFGCWSFVGGGASLLLAAAVTLFEALDSTSGIDDGHRSCVERVTGSRDFYLG
jgi:hypothetical protein